MLRYSANVENDEDAGHAITKLAAELFELCENHRNSTILVALAMALHETIMPMMGDAADQIHDIMGESGSIRSKISKARPKFTPGPIEVTDAAAEAMRSNDEELVNLILRHVQGDWGSADRNDRRMNDATLKAKDGRLMSVYYLKDGARIWVITELDGENQATTKVLLPSDY